MCCMTYDRCMTFDEALKYFGSRNRMAKALGCTRQNTTRWQTAGIPLVRQYQIEELTGRKLKRSSGPDSVADPAGR